MLKNSEERIAAFIGSLDAGDVLENTVVLGGGPDTPGGCSATSNAGNCVNGSIGSCEHSVNRGDCKNRAEMCDHSTNDGNRCDNFAQPLS